MAESHRGRRIREIMKLLAQSGRYVLALFLIVLGITTFILARQIPESGLQSEFDPGARAMPTIMAMFLMFGGLFEGLQVRRSEESATNEALGPFWLILGGLLLYALSMPYLGFSLATTFLAWLMAWWLGSRWWFALLFAIALVTVVQGLFVQLFRVQLPQGILGLPF